MGLHSPTPGTPFHVLEIQGLPKAGKTHLAGTAPGKVVIQSTDGGWDGVVQKIAGYEEKFLVENYIMEIDLQADDLLRSGDKKGAEEAAIKQANRITRETWNPLARDAHFAFTDASVRTLVWDLADQINEILRLANFGRLEKVPQINYGLVNAEYKSTIAQAHKHRKNMVLINGMKQKYRTVLTDDSKEKSVPVPGVFEARGNDSAGYLIHSQVECRFVAAAGDQGPTWYTKILMSRLNPEVTGMEVANVDWNTLMMLLAPAVPTELWEG